jgi:hypothetical protein
VYLLFSLRLNVSCRRLFFQAVKGMSAKER